eukprot:33504-Eustigmatos_ZCMA.PRE.1
MVVFIIPITVHHATPWISRHILYTAQCYARIDVEYGGLAILRHAHQHLRTCERSNDEMRDQVFLLAM